MTEKLAFGRRRFLGGVSALALATPLQALAAGAAPASFTKRAATAPVKGGTLIVGQYQETTFYDPNRQYSWETYRVDKHIYESLLAEDLSTPASSGPPPLIPALAESWQVSPDWRSFTFKLRQGVTFHDGTPFDADALHFNVRRFTDPSFQYFDIRSAASMKPVYGNLLSFKVIDSHSVQFVFKSPFLDFLRLLPQGNYVSGVFSPKALETYGQDGLAEHPTGTGPYRFAQRIHGEKTVLERNAAYWGRAPLIDRIIFRPIQDDNTRLTALEAGEIDILTRTPPDAVESLQSGGYQVLESPQAGQLFLSWNFRNKYGADRTIRQAIIQAINRQGIAEQLLRGHALPSCSIFNIGNEAYDPAQRDFAYDPKAARDLIAKAGYKDGEIRFTIITDEANQSIIEWIQRDLGAVGIKVDIVSQEWLVYTSNLGKLAPDVALFAMEWGFITPYWLKLVYNGYVVARGGGEGAISSDLGPAVTQAAEATERTQAIALWKAANAIFQREAGIVPLVTFMRYFTTGANLRGFNVPEQNFYDLTPVWFEK